MNLIKEKKDQVWIGADHAGYDLKEALKKYFSEILWHDVGSMHRERVDYPDYAMKLSKELLKAANPQALGILICGSGAGMCMVANKCVGIRAALAFDPVSARLAREHNHAHVLCLGARFFAPAFAIEIVQAFLKAKPSKHARHLQRLKKMMDFEKNK